MDTPWNTWKARVASFDYDRSRKMIVYRDTGGQREYIKLGTLEVRVEPNYHQTPDDVPFTLHSDELGDIGQAIMDAMWEAGYRPTGGAQFNEQMELKDKHLQDMRAIVATKLGVKLT